MYFVSGNSIRPSCAASSTFLNVAIGATGPKISSFRIRSSCGTSATTVGHRNSRGDSGLSHGSASGRRDRPHHRPKAVGRRESMAGSTDWVLRRQEAVGRWERSPAKAKRSRSLKRPIVAVSFRVGSALRFVVRNRQSRANVPAASSRFPSAPSTRAPMLTGANPMLNRFLSCRNPAANDTWAICRSNRASRGQQVCSFTHHNCARFAWSAKIGATVHNAT